MYKTRLFVVLIGFLLVSLCGQASTRKVLIVSEEQIDKQIPSSAIAKQLANLLGHFEVSYSFTTVSEYKEGASKGVDFVFYVGFSADNTPSKAIVSDLLKSTKPVFWIDNGLSKLPGDEVKAALGFQVSGKTAESFDVVKSGEKSFSKRLAAINKISVSGKNVSVVASATMLKSKRDVPYIVRSGNFWYIADNPFLAATETDRYLLFCDLLHDFLGEDHPVMHGALVRIEDVTPMDNPDNIRKITDILSSKQIPFSIGFVPIYVNPAQGIQVRLSEKPEMVDALKYACENGATIVMHGVTHQYRGLTADDFEFWDGSRRQAIADERPSDLESKIKMGINEFFKNDIYPLSWETPHYTASQVDYKVFSKFFSSAYEQRLTIDNSDYSQYFPYIINKDMNGQMIFPENQGYIYLSTDRQQNAAQVERLIANTKVIHQTRDGVASFFFHSFLDLDLLTEIVDGIKANGFTFMDIRKYPHVVNAGDKIITNRNGSYKLNLDNSYLFKQYFDQNFKLVSKTSGTSRVKGNVDAVVNLKPGQIFVAEPIEEKVKQVGFFQQKMLEVKSAYTNWVTEKDNWYEAKVKVCWNEYARGASFRDQSSFAAIFNSVNIPVDTVFIGQPLGLENCNVLVVPCAYADSLTEVQLNRIVDYVKAGGNVVTDRKNKLAQKLGLVFFDSNIKVFGTRDKLYPQQVIAWHTPQTVYKCNVNDNDLVFDEDASTELPLVFGRQIGDGKLLFFNSLFDPTSTLGYSLYPYALDYMQKFFSVKPIILKKNIDYFFDPGLRQTTSVENLVKLWVKQGVRYIHAAGWHQYKKYQFDYGRLIRLCHANGILVYLWMEPPQVNQLFWEKHPEWREKNYTGKDVRASWRYPVALTDPACFKAAMGEYMKVLNAFDWDGVNIAELYFESDRGFANPDKFMPMHPSASIIFNKEYGFNMSEVFTPGSRHFWQSDSNARKDVVEFRAKQVTLIHDKLLAAVENYKRKRQGFDVIVTIMDSYISPEIREYHGVDYRSIIALQKKYGFRLQVEDPEYRWNDSPDRYNAIGKAYAKLSGSRTNLMLDLNIMQFRRPGAITPFPTSTQTGIESYHLVKSASQGASRLTIYCEASVNMQDISWFNHAAASDVVCVPVQGGYEVQCPTNFYLKLPKDTRVISVDNIPVIGKRDNEFFIPSGKHIVSMESSDLPGFSTAEIQTQILSCSGNVTNLTYDMRKVTFDYESDMRTLASFTSEPASITVDGKVFAFTAMKGEDCFSVMLPGGKHSVVVITGSSLSYTINLTSLWSTNAIVLYGFLAVLSIVAMYLFMKMYRRKYQ